MKKNLALPAAALAGGVIAFALRLAQNKTGFEAETGLPVSGNLAGLLLAAFLAAMAAVLILLVRLLPKESPDSAPSFPADFSTADTRLLVLPIMGVALIGLAGLADLYESTGTGLLLAQLGAAADPTYVLSSSMEVEAYGAYFSSKSQLILGILSLASAAGLFFPVAACRRGGQTRSNSPLDGTLLLIPPAALVVRLVMTYRIDSVNPALAAYYVEILALVFLTLGAYRLSSFAFKAGQTPRFAFYACAAVVLGIAALADASTHIVYLSSLLLYAGGALVLLGFLLLRLFHLSGSDPHNTTDGG